MGLGCEHSERFIDDGQHLSHSVAACRNGHRGSMIIKRAELFEARRQEHLRRFADQPRLADALLHDIDRAQ